ncbi:MAG TPA: hypothetical protein VKT73_13180 [Xanthobacteraceae bacterium]|nr:hypothetical protein [Xanthobacteraceae bacterium]
MSSSGIRCSLPGIDALSPPTTDEDSLSLNSDWDSVYRLWSVTRLVNTSLNPPVVIPFAPLDYPPAVRLFMIDRSTGEQVDIPVVGGSIAAFGGTAFYASQRYQVQSFSNPLAGSNPPYLVSLAAAQNYGLSTEADTTAVPLPASVKFNQVTVWQRPTNTTPVDSLTYDFVVMVFKMR